MRQYLDHLNRSARRVRAMSAGSKNGRENVRQGKCSGLHHHIIIMPTLRWLISKVGLHISIFLTLKLTNIMSSVHRRKRRIPVPALLVQVQYHEPLCAPNQQQYAARGLLNILLCYRRHFHFL